jgi:hypothetical protein
LAGFHDELLPTLYVTAGYVALHLGFVRHYLPLFPQPQPLLSPQEPLPASFVFRPYIILFLI